MGHRQYYYCRRRAHNGFSFHDHDDGEGDGASGKSLKYLTRLLFIAILLSCLVIIITSVLTLVNCRQASRAIEGLIDSSDGHCTSLGLPAYFACVLLLFSVFGFGCLGRRVTGIVLVLVSLAEMALAVVMTLREDCPLPDADATAARLNLTLQQCGLLLPSPNGSVTHVFSEEHVLLQQQLSHSHDTQCLEMASNFHRLCGVPSPSTPTPVVVNKTVIRHCAGDMADKLYSLCTQDSDVVVPILLTVPIFYVGVAVALIYIKHVDSYHQSLGEARAITVGTNTDGGGGGGANSSGAASPCVVCSRSVSSLCMDNLLCLECAVRGRQCTCWRKNKPTLPSRLSFQLKDVAGEDEVRRSILRTSSHGQQDDPNIIEDCV